MTYKFLVAQRGFENLGYFLPKKTEAIKAADLDYHPGRPIRVYKVRSAVISRLPAADAIEAALQHGECVYYLN